MSEVRGRATAAVCLLLFALFWIASVVYLVCHGASPQRPIIALVAFAIVLPALSWLFTRKAAPRPIPIERPMRELVAVLGYLILYAFYFLGWATGAVEAATHAGPEREVAEMLLNLGVGVSAPAVLLFLLGANLGPLFAPGLGRKGFWPILLVVGPLLIAVVGGAATNPKVAQAFALPPATLAWGAPAAFVWLSVSMGLSEEFLFRAVLQSRLAAVLESEIGAAIVAALMFAMAHVPGVYFRGGAGTPGYSTDLIHVVAYSICVMAPLGLLAGVIWARTRSLLLIVLIHGCAILLTGLVDFVADWG